MKLFKIFSVAAALFMTGCSTSASNHNVETVSPREFQTRLAESSDAYLLDVRRPDEFAAGHLEGAHLLNWLDTAKFKQDINNIDKSQTIFIYCRSGRRSNAAAEYLSAEGYTVVDMKGGILSWEKDGLPLTTESD